MPTLQFKFLVFSLLLLTVATTLASSQYEGFNLRLNTSIIKSKDDNLLSLICHYHTIQDNEKTTDEIRIHRAANVLSFWLNDTQITSGTNGGLPGYREWDFESGAMAQFILPKKDIFIGLFCCKSMTETSSMVQLISMPEKDLSVALYMAVAVCSLFLALLILLSIFTFVLCYKQFQKRRFDSLKDARFSSSRSKKRTISEYPQRPTAMNTSCTNLFTINLETGQQEDRSSKPTNTSCTKFEKNEEDHSLCSSTLSEEAGVKQFCYIDSPEEVMFDCKGGRYRNEDHDIELSVPEFAIPTGKRITVKIAVSLFSPLQLQQGLRPVSPIVEFCVVDDPYFKFAKPIKILLPHFMSTTSSSLNDLQFVKAAHGGGVFEECDGEATFKAGNMYGTLLTHHFCHFCIASSVSSLSKANFRLVRVTPKNPSGTWKAQYCVTYFLQTCLKFLKNFYDVEQYEVTSLKRFMFSDAQATLQINFERRLAGGWLLTQDGGSSKLTENEVDCWRLDQDELKQMEEEELYPPRFVVKVNGHQATDQATALVRFTGAQGDLETELSLEPLSYHHTTHLPTSVSLPNIRPYGGPKQSQQYNLVNPNTPSLSFLMNYIAAEIPAKWRAVGTQLNLSNGKLDQIEYEHRGSCDCCFSAVFSLWESQPNSAALPYEWLSLYEALRSPQVSENQLANKLEMIVSTTTSNVSLSGNGKDSKDNDDDDDDVEID